MRSRDGRMRGRSGGGGGGYGWRSHAWCRDRTWGRRNEQFVQRPEEVLGVGLLRRREAMRGGRDSCGGDVGGRGRWSARHRRCR